MKNNISKYKAKRKLMQNGDVIAFQGRDLGAKAIQKGTKSKYSHVGLVVRIKEVSVDRIFILESVTTGGVVLLPLKRKLQNYNGKAWWLSLKVNANKQNFAPEAIEEGVRTFIYKWAMGELGKKYDFKLIGSIIKNILFNKSLPKQDSEQYICSELVAKAFKEVGILPKNLSANLTPKKIVNLPVLNKPEVII